MPVGSPACLYPLPLSLRRSGACARRVVVQASQREWGDRLSRCQFMHISDVRLIQVHLLTNSSGRFSAVAAIAAS